MCHSYLTFCFRYDGYISYKVDIATIIIAGYFEYQPHIVPACLNFTEDPAEKYPRNGTKALVVGWGLSKDTKQGVSPPSFYNSLTNFTIL